MRPSWGPQSRRSVRHPAVTATGRTTVTPDDQCGRVFNALRQFLIPAVALAVCAEVQSCSKPTSRADALVQQGTTPARGACTGTWLSPSAIPPDPGMWTDQDAASSARVVAMIGPADVRPGSTAVTRTT